MKINVERLLLSVLLGVLSVPVVAVYEPITVAPKNETVAFDGVDSAKVTYKKVAQFPAESFDARVVFGNQESTQDLKVQFAERVEHKSVKKSIIPGVKNLFAIASAWVVEFRHSAAISMTKTVFVQLKNERDSVVARVALRKQNEGSKQLITAEITIEGLLYAEPVYLSNLLYAVFVKDVFTLKAIHALYAAGVAGLGYLAFAKWNGWKPFTPVATTLMRELVAGLEKELAGASGGMQSAPPRPNVGFSSQSARVRGVQDSTAVLIAGLVGGDDFAVPARRQPSSAPASSAVVTKTFAKAGDEFELPKGKTITEITGGFIGLVTCKQVLENNDFLQSFEQMLRSRGLAHFSPTILNRDAKFILIVPASVWYEDAESSKSVIHAEVAKRLNLMGNQAQVIVVEDRKAQQQVERTDEQVCDDATTSGVDNFTYINVDQKDSKKFSVKFMGITRHQETARRVLNATMIPLLLDATFPFTSEQMQKLIGRVSERNTGYAANRQLQTEPEFVGEIDLTAHAWVSVLQENRKQFSKLTGQIKAFKSGDSTETCLGVLQNAGVLVVSTFDMLSFKSTMQSSLQSGISGRVALVGTPRIADLESVSGMADLAQALRGVPMMQEDSLESVIRQLTIDIEEAQRLVQKQFAALMSERGSGELPPEFQFGLQGSFPGAAASSPFAKSGAGFSGAPGTGSSKTGKPSPRRSDKIPGSSLYGKSGFPNGSKYPLSSGGGSTAGVADGQEDKSKEDVFNNVKTAFAQDQSGKIRYCDLSYSVQDIQPDQSNPDMIYIICSTNVDLLTQKMGKVKHAVGLLYTAYSDREPMFTLYSTYAATRDSGPRSTGTVISNNFVSAIKTEIAWIQQEIAPADDDESPVV